MGGWWTRKGRGPETCIEWVVLEVRYEEGYGSWRGNCKSNCINFNKDTMELGFGFRDIWILIPARLFREIPYLLSYCYHLNLYL